MKAFLVPLLALCCAAALAAPVDPDSVAARIARQADAFPQEKIHVTTDRASYLAGDTIWMRIHIVDDLTGLPVAWSKYAYAELKDPFDSVAARVRIAERDGAYHGYIPLDPRMPDGDYTLAAHTLFMDNAGEEYHFSKPIAVKSPMALRARIDAAYEWRGSDLYAKLSIVDARSGQPLEYADMSCTTADGETRALEHRSDGPVTVKVKPSQMQRPYILARFDGRSSFLRLPRPEGAAFHASFHPEGGALVPGEECRVAFKAIGPDGLSVEAQGEVIDKESGAPVARIATSGMGLGEFEFAPQAGKAYAARLALAGGDPIEFALPEADPRAASLRVTASPDTIVGAALGAVPDGSFIFIHQRGLPLAAAPADEPQGFSPGWFPAGIVQILLIDPSGNTLAERLAFAGEPRWEQARITPDKPSYGTRKPVRISIEAAPNASLAVSVVDASAAEPDTASSIAAQMLLQGELRGHVENPARFLRPESRADLDRLMLTQGWRRYDVPAAVRGDIAEPEIPLERGLALAGTVRSLWKEAPMPGVTVSAIAPTEGINAVGMTDQSGAFQLDVPDFPDGTPFVIQAKKKAGKLERNLAFADAAPSAAAPIPSAYTAQPETHAADDEAEYQRIMSNPSLADVMLKEVEVIGRQTQDMTPMESLLSTLAKKSYNKKYLKDNNITSFEEVLRRIAGISIVGGTPFYRGRQIAIMIDGVIQDAISGPGGSPTSPFEVIRGRRSTYSGKYSGSFYGTGTSAINYLEESIPMDLVKQIDFIQPAMAVAFGSKATQGGLLSITTGGWDPSDARKKNNPMKLIYPLGVQKPAEFYSPKYTPADTSGSDYRATLYWNPVVETDENGTAEIEFYTSDNPSLEMRILTEGIGNDGELISTHSTPLQ